MTYGTEDIQWDEEIVRGKWLEKAQRLQSGSPDTSSLSSLKTRKSCHFWRARGRNKHWVLSSVLKKTLRRLLPRKINYFTQGLRLAKRWSWVSNSVLSPPASSFNSLLIYILILFLPHWCPNTQANVSVWRLSMFSEIYSGISLEQFNISKELLLEDCFFILFLLVLLLLDFCDFQYSSHCMGLSILSETPSHTGKQMKNMIFS